MRSCRQMKDQTKKMANLKHKEQLEKSRNAQLMEDAKKREDNLNESSQQIKVKEGWCFFPPRRQGRSVGGETERGSSRQGEVPEEKVSSLTSIPLPCLEYCSYHNNASSQRDTCDREQPEAMSNTLTFPFLARTRTQDAALGECAQGR